MYRIIAIIGSLVRFFVLPNPFSMFEYGVLINFLAEPFIHILTYKTVGIFYSRNSFPIIGSILYLVFYAMNIGLILFRSFTGAKLFIGVIIIIVYYWGLFSLRIKADFHINAGRLWRSKAMWRRRHIT